MVTVSYAEPLNQIETVTANSDKETHYYSLTEDQADICDKKSETEGPSLTTMCVLIGFVCSLYPPDSTHVMYVIEGT